MSVEQTLIHILSELRGFRRDLKSDTNRIFVENEVQRALGASDLHYFYDGEYWKLVVWFGKEPHHFPTESSMLYSAYASRGFTTEEAIAIIRKQLSDAACAAGADNGA